MKRLAKKALWAYKKACGLLDIRPCSEALFFTSFMDATMEAERNAEAARMGYWWDLPRSIPTQKALVVLWHFPEYPLLLRQVRRKDALVMVAKGYEWMRAVAGGGQFEHMGERSLPVNLVRALSSGRPVAVMLDYCYQGTERCAPVNFMGRKATMPDGILELARRYGYSVHLLGPVEGYCHEILRIEKLTPGEGEPAQIITSAIEGAILAAPGRWLLWPSLDRRWWAAGADWDIWGRTS